MILFGKPQTEAETTRSIDDGLTPITEQDATRIVGGQTPQMDIGDTGDGRPGHNVDPTFRRAIGTAEI
jgi:hypothetical protein